jgi:hypothetical protein
MTGWCEKEGVVQEWSGRYRHDQNGVAERRVQSVGNCFRTMMLYGNAPETDCAYALMHANVIVNNSPTKANAGWTPKEKDVGYMLPFNRRLGLAPLFCLCFAHIYRTEPSRASNKDAARAVVCVYLGFDPVSYTYIVKEWASGAIYYTTDVDFHPTRFPYRTSPTNMSEFLYGYENITPYLGVSAGRRLHESSDEGKHGSTPDGDTRSSMRVYNRTHSAGVDVTSIPDMDMAPPQQSSALVVRGFNPEPTWAEAMTQTEFVNDWVMARLTEQASFDFHDVYDLVPRSQARGKQIHNSVEVLKVKFNPPTPEHVNGTMEKFKYRLTIAARTKTLTQGIDYEEKHASTVRWDSVKTVLAIAVYMDYDMALFDIAAFFLYGKLYDEVYMQQPKSWVSPDKPATDYVWKLKKSMYGLPQASHCAQKELNANLIEGGFMPTASDDCIYVTKNVEQGYAAMGAHVDDIITIGTASGLKRAEDTLLAKFKITKRVNPHHITGVEIERNREARWMKLHQTQYTMELLKRHNMQDCKPVDTPMDAGTAKAMMLLPTPSKCELHSTTPALDFSVVKQYQQLVGELVWLCIRTRPDIRFAVSLIARFVSCATQAHLNLAKQRILRYLRGTITDGLVFLAGEGAWLLSGSGDSDLAGDLATQRSTLGHYLKLGQHGAAITHCGLERKLCTATGQAETYAMVSLVKDAIWLRALLYELHFPMHEPTLLATDNDGVFLQSTKAVNHTTAKHYRISQAFIRSKVFELIVKVIGVNTNDNGADIFTKALARAPFLRHKSTIMGPQDRPEGSI